MIIETEDGEDITIRGGQVVKGDVEPGVYRLVICLDVEAFDPEGDAIDPDELQEARMKVFARKQGE